MKICLISRGYPPEVIFGGIETYVYNLAHGLTRLGHKVLVLAETRREEGITKNGNLEIVRLLIKPKSAFGPVSKTLAYRWQIFQRLKQEIQKKKIDIIEAPENGAVSFFYSLFPNKKIPLVIRTHTPLFLSQKMNQYPPLNLKTRISEWMEKEVIIKADRLTAPSLALAKIIAKKYKLDLRKIKIIPNPIDEKKFKPTLILRNEPNVLFVGRLERNKGTDFLIKAIPRVLQKVPQARFIFVGKGNKNFVNNLNQTIKKNGIKPNIQLLGHQDYPKLISLYQNAALCVIPSRWENFPYVCLEAMASGLPIVASKIGGLKESLVEEGKNGFLVPVGNIKLLSARIIKLLKNPYLREKMGQKSRQRVMKYYSTLKVASNMVKFYNQVINLKKE
jgi:glycosyltransferase involved in cell wall biosynthesis